jgi:acetyl esterase/lipase
MITGLWESGILIPEGASVMTTRRRFVTSTVALPLLAAVHPTLAQESTPAAEEDKSDVISDITYSDEGGQPLMLDVHRPPLREKPRPAVVLIHGGAWTEGFADRTSMSANATMLMARVTLP